MRPDARQTELVRAGYHRLNRGTRAVLIACISCFALRGQIPEDGVGPFTGLQVMNYRSAWAWGDTGAGFRLWHVDVDSQPSSPMSIPREMIGPEANLDASSALAHFFTEKHGLLIWTRAVNCKSAYGSGACGIRLLTAETVDGARTWRLTCNPEFQHGAPLGAPKEIDFVDSNAGWLLLSSESLMSSIHHMLFSTTDGGHSWHKSWDSDDPAGLRMHLFGPMRVHLCSRSEGWMLAGRAFTEPRPNIFLFHTTDGGFTWTKRPVFIEPLRNCADCSLYNLSDMLFDEADPRRAFFEADFADEKSASVTYRSNDGGFTWSGPEAMAAPPHHPLEETCGTTLAFADYSFGLEAVCLKRGNISRVRVFATRDRGHTWQAMPQSLSEFFNPNGSTLIRTVRRKQGSIWMLIENGANPFGVSISAVLYSSDDGAHWKALRFN